MAAAVGAFICKLRHTTYWPPDITEHPQRGHFPLNNWQILVQFLFHVSWTQTLQCYTACECFLFPLSRLFLSFSTWLVFLHPNLFEWLNYSSNCCCTKRDPITTNKSLLLLHTFQCEGCFLSQCHVTNVPKILFTKLENKIGQIELKERLFSSFLVHSYNSIYLDVV